MWENKQGGFFYGWLIVAVCGLALIVSNGLSINGIPVFYKFVQTDLVRAEAVPPERIQSVYGIATALTLLLSGFFSPVAGFLLQRLNARKMMIMGCFILGAGIFIYSRSSSALSIYLAHILLGTSLGFVGVIVTTVLVSNWFVRKRGTALGIVLTGTSFGGVLIPLISTPLINNFGWRWAMLLISLTIWVLLLPAVIVLVRNRPGEIGLLPDGEVRESENGHDDRRPELNGFTLGEALKTSTFWLFALCAALIFYAIFVVSQQLNLYLQSSKIGFTPAEASSVQSLLFALSIVGKFLYGYLSDKFTTSRVMLISAATMFLSTLAFLDFNDRTVYLFAVLFGMNYGGTFVLLQLLVAEYFGVKEYGKILGAVIMIETIGGALGTIITGRVADAYGGDFTVAFYGLIVVSAFSLGTVILLNLTVRKREIRA
jgi:sugar phosphate permease